MSCWNAVTLATRSFSSELTVLLLPAPPLPAVHECNAAWRSMQRGALQPQTRRSSERLRRNAARPGQCADKVPRQQSTRVCTRPAPPRPAPPRPAPPRPDPPSSSTVSSCLPSFRSCSITSSTEAWVSSCAAGVGRGRGRARVGGEGQSGGGREGRSRWAGAAGQGFRHASSLARLAVLWSSINSPPKKGEGQRP